MTNFLHLKFCNFILFCCLSNVLSYSVDEITKTHQWAVAIDGGEGVAKELARAMGLSFKGQVGSLDIYLLEGKWPQSHRLSPFAKIIKKREAHTQSQSWLSEMSAKLSNQRGVRFSERQIAKRRVKRSTDSMSFNDPVWPKSWYMLNGAKGRYDMNVRGAWQAGYTGTDIVVSILDDGIERDNPDLAANYDPLASKDINGGDDDPSPRYDSVDTNRHGTRCAGQVAAVANNNFCTVGVAFNARIGGVRMLDGGITDAVEAASLSLNPQHIDIYSASWGPDDNGKALDGPGVSAKEAFVSGVLKGRGGKGNIFVWASGNGGNADDSCACDGYANSIFTLSISSTSENGVKPWYLEECASTIATTYSSGEPSNDRQIVTTDIHHRCTERHTGTSASAPLAAGMVALALQANPRLTWRDVQHIVAETSKPEPLNDANWIINGVGRKVSTRYGYGLMNGLEMVRAAERWKTVPAQKICVAYLTEKPRDLVGQSSLVLETTVDACTGTNDNVRYLEHVQAHVTLSYSHRGDVTIYLTSPAGTRSQMLPPRSHDRGGGEFREWPFMSVQFWGETGAGKWKIEIVNVGARTNNGVFKMWRLVLYGTETAPESSILKREGIQSATGSPLPVPVSSFPVNNSICHPECDGECKGPSAADCVKCKHYRMSGGVCVANCLPQFFRDEETKSCIACSPHCTSCISSTICASCPAHMYLSPNRTDCVKECPTGFCQNDDEMVCEKCPGRCPEGFYDKWMWGCAPCHETCLKCSSHSATSCLKCRNGLSFDTKRKLCVPPRSKCALNEFEFHHKCTRCHPLCRSCVGGTEQDCTSCAINRYFFNGTCVAECPEDHVPFEENDPNDAGRVHRQCIYCFEGDDDNPESPVCKHYPTGKWLNSGSRSGSVYLVALITVFIVLVFIGIYFRARRRFRSVGGKQYVPLTSQKGFDRRNVRSSMPQIDSRVDKNGVSRTANGRQGRHEEDDFDTLSDIQPTTRSSSVNSNGYYNVIT